MFSIFKYPIFAHGVKICIALVILLLPASLFGQISNVSSITISDGLSQGYVPSIVQCKRGYLWFATGDGLDRYDGTEIKQYKNNIDDDNSLIRNALSMIQEDDLGRIWIITQKFELECFNPETEKFHHLNFQLKDKLGDSFSYPLLKKTKDGALWISTVNSLTEIIGVNQHDLEKVSFKNYIAGENMPNFAPYHYPMVTQSGELILTMPNKELKQFNKANNLLEEFPRIKNLKLKEISFVFNSINGQYTWVYLNGRLQAWRSTELIYDFPFSIEFDRSFAASKNYIYIDNEDHIWMLLKGQILKYKIDDLEANYQIPKIIIVDRFCETMSIDKNNNLWIGTGGYGVRNVNTNQTKFAHWFPNISPMSFDKFKDDTYIINSTTLANENGELLKRSFDGRSVAIEGIEYVLDDTQNYRKLNIKKDNTEKIIDIPILNEAIPYIDKHKNYWLFFQNSELGMKWFDNDTIQYHDYSRFWKSKSPVRMNSVFESIDGSIYLSCSKGLIQINIDQIKKEIDFKKGSSGGNGKLNSDVILCSMDDPLQPNKFLWVGTKGAGMNLMEKKTGNCTYFSKENGLPNNVVYGILPDQFGHLWLSTNFGLSQFNIKNKQFRNFTAKEHGLQAEEFNTSAYFKLHDGRLAFGGVNGVSVFDPKDFLPDTTYSNVVFKKLKINNKEVNFGDTTNILKKPIDFAKKIKLKHYQNFVSLSHASIGGQANGNDSYYYKMEGIDKEWIFANKSIEHSYPNLSPGNYVFMISNLNQAGIRNPNPKKISISIANPWWRTWLAYLIYASIFGALVFSFLKFRLNRIKMQQDLSLKEKQTEQLKELDELKTRFFSNITHEFRTPLTLIKEPSRQLMKHNDSEVKQQSSVIFNNANRLLLLVNQLMDVAKLEDGKMKINDFHGDILIVLKEIFGYFKPLAESKDQTLIWECDLEKLITTTDKQIIEKILYNLLSNAHKFTPRKGVIKLKIHATKNELWQMIVEDEGVGIAENELSKIFDRFYQTDGSNTRQGEGTGIGLALVKELVNLLEGEIKVESHLGKGTTFSITFPISNRHEHIKEEAMDDYPSSSLVQEILQPAFIKRDNPENEIATATHEKELVLLVEDNSDMRDYISGILLNNNYSVIEANDGEEGIAMAIKNIPDLIISDIMMPKKDGYELLVSLKENTLTSHIPIVLLTAKVRLESKIKGYARKADAYLVKPFNTEELLTRLNQLLVVRKQIQFEFQQNENKNPIKNASMQVKNKNDDSVGLSKMDLEWIKNLQNIIEEKIGSESFSVDELSVELLMSRTQFYSKVKALTGLTPAVLVRNIRLDLAYKMLLDSPELKFSEIANALGMADFKYFKKLFIKHFNKTPKEIRENL